MVLDKNGRVASTVSSGGIALKQPGRVGQAAVFGCGCWAQRGSQQKSSPFTVGISTTGCGEHLVRTFLARECAQNLRTSSKPLNSLQEVMREKFAESDFLGKLVLGLIYARVSTPGIPAPRPRYTGEFDKFSFLVPGGILSLFPGETGFGKNGQFYCKIEHFSKHFAYKIAFQLIM